MKLFSIFKVLFLSLVLAAIFPHQAQTPSRETAEILSNADIILMARTNLSKTIIINKIKDTKGAFDVSVQGLVDLKKAGVDEEIINAMLEKSRVLREKSAATSNISGTEAIINSVPTVAKSHADVLRSSKTVAIEKSSINPSRQALEKELLKRPDWQKLNLNIVRYKEAADLRIEIGFVPLSVITHRYVFRVYDNRSGTVIVAGETTSWGSLAENLARKISQNLVKVL